MEKEINNHTRVKSLIGPLHVTRSVGKNLQSILISLILVGAFTSLEIVYGILSKSNALNSTFKNIGYKGIPYAFNILRLN